MVDLIEPVTLPELGMSVGFIFIQGAGMRVGTKSQDGRTRHLSIAAARRLATSLEETTEGGELAPAIEALRSQADRLEEYLAGKPMPNVLKTLPPMGAA